MSEKLSIKILISYYIYKILTNKEYNLEIAHVRNSKEQTNVLSSTLFLLTIT